VHHRVDALDQRTHRAGVGQVGLHHLLARRGRTQRRDVGHAQHRAVRGQPPAQLDAQAAGGAGQQQAMERGGRGRGHGWMLSDDCHMLSYNWTKCRGKGTDGTEG